MIKLEHFDSSFWDCSCLYVRPNLENNNVISATVVFEVLHISFGCAWISLHTVYLFHTVDQLKSFFQDFAGITDAQCRCCYVINFLRMFIHDQVRNDRINEMIETMRPNLPTRLTPTKRKVRVKF